jgi:hypothetical protein
MRGGKLLETALGRLQGNSETAPQAKKAGGDATVASPTVLRSKPEKSEGGHSAPFSPYPLVRAATGSPSCERDNFTWERARRRPRTGPGSRPDGRRG